jgi:exosome complex component RRP42
MVSERDEDPLFNDDWEASTYLFPRVSSSATEQKPPVTLLVMSVGDTILFDPSTDELAVADSVIALSVVSTASGALGLVALRTIDPPSRLTAAGVPDVLNTTTGSTSAQALSSAEVIAIRENDQGKSVWRPPRGGMRRTLLNKTIKAVLEQGGVGQEIMDGLANVKT